VSQGDQLYRRSWSESLPGLVRRATFETASWLKVEVEDRPSSGTDPTAGPLELTVGNGRDATHLYHPCGDNWFGSSAPKKSFPTDRERLILASISLLVKRADLTFSGGL